MNDILHPKGGGGVGKGGCGRAGQGVACTPPTTGHPPTQPRHRDRAGMGSSGNGAVGGLKYMRMKSAAVITFFEQSAACWN